MYQLKFILPGLPKISTNGPHGDWRVKAARARQWQRSVMLAIGQRKPIKPLTKAQIVFTRFSSRRPDFDNMVASFKHVQDGLIKAGIIVDDSFETIGEPKYLWEQVPRNGGYVMVEIEGIFMDEADAQGRAF